MAIIIPDITIGLNQPKQTAIELALKKLGLTQDKVKSSYIVKSSVDARKKEKISLVYSVAIEVEDEENIIKRARNCNAVIKKKYNLAFETGTQLLMKPPVIAGFGPAGMFIGLILARNGYRPIVLERGGDVDARVAAVNGFWAGEGLDLNTNVQFGEGGAGTFSDGKLTTRINDDRCDFVLDELCKHGAPADILEKAKPHIGTDHLRKVVKSIREEIISRGGQVLFYPRLDDITEKDGRLVSVTASGQRIETEILALCIGHSARDTIGMLLQKQIDIESKAFSVGVRIEHLQSELEKSLYGNFAGHAALPRGEYQLSHRYNGRGVYTFCMCPGGFVVPASTEEGMVVTNGMSRYLRDGKNANSALVVGVEPKDFGGGVLGGIEFQHSLEAKAYLAGGGGYKAPAQTVNRFLSKTTGLDIKSVEPTYANGVADANLAELFPPFISDMLRLGLINFNTKIKGFAAADAVITGVETRTSSPVRILRDETMQSKSLQGMYPCGEGAGYAGGIVSAAVDGVKAALEIMKLYKPMY